jgi:hypothetical protein
MHVSLWNKYVLQWRILVSEFKLFSNHFDLMFRYSQVDVHILLRLSVYFLSSISHKYLPEFYKYFAM